MNTLKTKELQIFSSRKIIAPPPIDINGSSIEKVHSSKLLGVYINDKLNWSDNTQHTQNLGYTEALLSSGLPTLKDRLV